MKDRITHSRKIDPTAIAWVVSFVDRFENPQQKLAIPRGVEECPDGIITFPWTEYSADVIEFEKGLYEQKPNVVFGASGTRREARSGGLLGQARLAKIVFASICECH